MEKNKVYNVKMNLDVVFGVNRRESNDESKSRYFQCKLLGEYRNFTLYEVKLKNGFVNMTINKSDIKEVVLLGDSYV